MPVKVIIGANGIVFRVVFLNIQEVGILKRAKVIVGNLFTHFQGIKNEEVI